MVLLALLIGLGVGVVVTWLVMRERVASAERDRVSSDHIETTMKALAADALRSNNESFLDLALPRLDQKEQAVRQLVAPIEQKLQQVDGELRGLERARLEAYSTLSQQVRTLAEGQERLRGETGNLVTALRAPATRGRWGEIQLRRVVEMAGMIAHCDFAEQATVSTDDGRFRPDLVVKLPGGKNIVVDAKVPLEAYLAAHESQDEETRNARLRDHARQVRQHISKLSAKAYWEQFKPAPEFVVLFLASDAFHSAALEQDPTLIEQGVHSRVLIATPTTLIALLQAVAHGWNQETIAESAAKLHALGSELYERLGSFTGHLATLGKRLDGSVQAYNQAIGSLERRVLVSARRFPDLGVTTKSDLPTAALIETAAQPPQTAELAPRAVDAA